MKCKVYKSLDHPSAFFGIRGRFITLLGTLIFVAAVIAGIVGSILGSLFGFTMFFIGVASAYFFVMSLQSKFSDRELTRRLNARKYVRYVHVRPGPVRAYWKDDQEQSNS